MLGSLDPHMYRRGKVEAEHLHPHLPNSVDFISRKTEQLGKCVLGSSSAVVSVSLRPVLVGHLRCSWVLVWRLLSLLWQPEVFADKRSRSVKMPSNTCSRKENTEGFEPGLSLRLGLPGGLETDLSGVLCVGKVGCLLMFFRCICQHVSLYLMWTKMDY